MFFVKSQIVNILGFAGRAASGICTVKAALGDMQTNDVAVCR